MTTAILVDEVLGEVADSVLVPMKSDEALYELVNGQHAEMPPLSNRAATIASRLATKLNMFAATNRLGEAIVDLLIRVCLPQDPGRNRRPDVSYISYSQDASDVLENLDAPASDVVPDIAIEVTSPSDLAEDQREKVMEYFQIGVRGVWVFYPRLGIVDVYDSPTTVRTFRSGDVFVGDPILPGFRFRLAELFEPFGPPKS